jgi:hypothetical protein
MTALHALESFLLRSYVRVRTEIDDRGDVPGWVLITVMTAALVSALLFTAQPLLRKIFTRAVNSVSS